MSEVLPKGVQLSANRLTKALRRALTDRPDAVELLRARCGDGKRFAAWLAGESDYESDAVCSRDGSSKRITRDGACWACKQRRSPFVLVGNKFDRARAVYAPDGRQRVGRQRWEGQRDAIRAERTGCDLGVFTAGVWTARALPTGRVVLTYREAGGRLEAIPCAKAHLDQLRERLGPGAFFRYLEDRPDLRAVLAACGWSL